MKTPGGPWPSDTDLAAIAAIQTAGFDKAEFALALRLLHVVWAWSGQTNPTKTENPARQDPLYPGLTGSKWPLYDAIEKLIKHHNYAPPASTSGSPGDKP